MVFLATVLFAAAEDGTVPLRPSPVSDNMHFPWVVIITGLVLGILGSAHFTILQHSFFSLDNDALRALNRHRHRLARVILRLRRDLARTWFTLLVGEIAFKLLLGLSVTAAGLNFLGGWFFEPAMGVWRLQAGFASVLLLCVVATLLVLILSEIAPNIITARWLRQIVPEAARWIRFWTRLFWPVTLLPLVLVRAGARARHEDIAERFENLEVEKRLLTLVGIGDVDVDLEEEEREMIDHVLEFGQSTAGDIMTPRSEMIGFDVELNQEQALDFMRATDVSRVLVYKASFDEIVGVLHRKHLMLDPTTDYHNQIRPALFVEDEMDLIDLLALMRAERAQLVIVLDDYGSTRGIVTLDDLLDAIVGQIPMEELPDKSCDGDELGAASEVAS